MYRLFVTVAIVCMTACAASAQAPITAVDVHLPHHRVQARPWSEPLVISSAQAAEGYFGAGAMKELLRQVDFERQFVLVFDWQGSGRDRLTFSVADSYPEQIFFSLKRGLTRDLRRHTQVYALRTDVLWRIQPEPDTGQDRRMDEGVQSRPEPGSRAWMEEVDQRAGLRDAHGCGPEIGSVEWMHAVSTQLGVFDALGHGPDLDSEEWRQAVHRKAFGTEP